MWFRQSEERFEQEKQVIASIVSEGWIKNVAWYIDEERKTVVADVDLLAGTQWWEAKIVFPFIYPYAPPQIMPRADARWSSHQWGRGELCLEIRADNWYSDLNSGHMLRSARKLLETESKVDATGTPLNVLSDHRFTEGQYLSFGCIRLVLTDDLIKEIQRRDSVVSMLEYTTIQFDSYFVFTGVSLIGNANFDEWIDRTIPNEFRTRGKIIGRIAKLAYGDMRHIALMDNDCSPAALWALFSDIPFDSPKLVVGVLNNIVLAKYLFSEEVINVPIISMDNQRRVPIRNQSANGKLVAIVGCGSMGSKVAASLVRSGVSKFLLIDGDVLKPDNLVRNDLDWFSVGAHKVDGVISRLRAIRPNVEVDSWHGRLDGHHSTATIIAALEKLSKCDLIVETSGSDQGFSVAAAVASQDSIPMIWGRVFGGGYGGYIVRSRPNIEFSPLEVRRQVYDAMTDPSLPKPPDDSDFDYGSGNDEQEAMIADDADVSVISAYLARMALDTLRPDEESDYPYSAYLISLRKEWLFENPFDTRPLNLPRIIQKAQR